MYKVYDALKMDQTCFSPSCLTSYGEYGVRGTLQSDVFTGMGFVLRFKMVKTHFGVVRADPAVKVHVKPWKIGG